MTHSSSTRFSFATGTNAKFVETMYRQFRSDPDSVDPSWRQFFEGYEFAANGSAVSAGPSVEANIHSQVEALINAYRRLGHLSADLNPLEDKPQISLEMLPESHGLADVDPGTIFHPVNLPNDSYALSDIVSLLKETYCERIGADYREADNVEVIVWFQRQMELCRNAPQLSKEQKLSILDDLTKAEGFERFLQDRYLGQKRFSLEGTDSLIPLLSTIAGKAAAAGVEEINLGMAHRGRLNVLANFMGKPYESLLKEFEGTEFNAFDIDGDVKYHKGFVNRIDTDSSEVAVCLLPNPSHLEAVNPVVEGFCFARQQRHEDGKVKVMPLLMHGDAAMMGQGVVAETLNLAELSCYSTGGTIHVIINNQIGFTAEPEEGRSCTYSSEIAKIIKAPVLHVNADDPEAVVWTAELAVAYRQRFGRDIVIDLIGYRRHGHNETDEPGFTQPLRYKKIKSHKTAWTLYSEQLDAEGVCSAAESKERMKDFRKLLQSKMEAVRAGNAKIPAPNIDGFENIMNYQKAGRDDFEKEVSTTVDEKTLQEVAKAITSVPSDFVVHPKIKRLLDTRRQMMEGSGKVDWGMAELLAYGSLATEGTRIRLSGQDSRRGTFSHRHAVLRDYETGKRFHLFENIENGTVDVVNSPLSEVGCMGFEFGYSVASPDQLVLWEAQFGDFANGAQIIIDQFLVASEAKWKQTSGLVLLLPHGYEGQGPEHSSARPERFLQLCGSLNIQVAYPTTPGQFFHLLRRQCLRHFNKPLVVMSPKSLLRHPKVISTVSEFSAGSFREVIDDSSIEDASKAKKVVVCTGKLYYELLEARDESKESVGDLPIIRIEQLYPFPDRPLAELLERYYNASELVWTQEEPQNMGAWYYIQHRLRMHFGDRLKVRYVGRKGSGSTAEGSNKAHAQEQARLIHDALGLACSIPSSEE